MIQTTHDRTITWLSDHIKANPDDLMKFREIRKLMKVDGQAYISCYLLDNKYLYGRFLNEARVLARQN